MYKHLNPFKLKTLHNTVIYNLCDKRIIVYKYVKFI